MRAVADVLTVLARPRTDSELVAACLDGDEHAWSQLIDRYSRLVYSIPLRERLTREEAADIFQAVCLDLVSELPKLRDPKALPAWLIRNTARKVTRWKMRSNRYVQDDDLASEAEDSVDLPDAVIERYQHEQMLRDGIEALPERCRAMVKMLFFETPARPYREVAQQLGVATGSIGFLRSRCLDRLRAFLERTPL